MNSLRYLSYKYSRFSFQTAKLFSRREGIGLLMLSALQMNLLLILRCFGFVVHSLPRIAVREKSPENGGICALSHVFEGDHDYGQTSNKFWSRVNMPRTYDKAVIQWCPFKLQRVRSSALSAFKLFLAIFLCLKKDLGLREAVNVSVRYTSAILLAIELSLILKGYRVLYMPVEGNPWEKFFVSCLAKIGYTGELRGCQYSVVRYGDGCILADVWFQMSFSRLHSATRSLSSKFPGFIFTPELMPSAPIRKRLPQDGEIRIAFLPEAEILEEQILKAAQDRVLPAVFGELNRVRSFKVFYRYHPRSPRCKESSSVVRQAALADFFSSVDLVIGRGSHAVVEAYGFEIPVCLVKISGDDQSLPIQIPEGPKSCHITLDNSDSWHSLQVLIERIS